MVSLSVLKCSSTASCSYSSCLGWYTTCPRVQTSCRASANSLQSSSNSQPSVDWRERSRQRVIAEIVEVACRSGSTKSPAAIREGLQTLQTLIPGFSPNLDAMNAANWAALAADADDVAIKVITLKTHYPQLDLGRVLAANPKLLLLSADTLDSNAQQVRALLSKAKNLQVILQEVPSLLDPKALFSVLTTINKWYNLTKDPVEVLEADPDIVRRAQENDVPFEPVYFNQSGQMEAPLLNYKEKRADWQKYIDINVFKQKDGNEK